MEKFEYLNSMYVVRQRDGDGGACAQRENVWKE